MPERRTTLGLLGPAPSPDCPPVLRAARFDHFQRHAGELAQASGEPWWVGHAACHALMNEVDAVVLAPVMWGRPLEPLHADRALWLGALQRLLDAPVDLVVAPGLTDLEVLGALAERLADTDDAPALLFDTARDAPPGAVVFAVDHLTRVAPGARLLTALPWVSTHSPGRPAAEPLPPSCVAPALVLGATTALTGLHEVAALPASPTELDALRRAGVLELVARGTRQQLTLRDRPSLPTPSSPAPDTTRAHLERADADPRRTAVEARLRADLDQALDTLAAESFDGRKRRTQQDLWSRARRTATVVLRGYEQRGEIVGFSVRCDAETNQGAHPLRPVVAISVQPRARSVSEFVMRMGGDD